MSNHDLPFHHNIKWQKLYLVIKDSTRERDGSLTILVSQVFSRDFSFNTKVLQCRFQLYFHDNDWFSSSECLKCLDMVGAAELRMPHLVDDVWLYVNNMGVVSVSTQCAVVVRLPHFNQSCLNGVLPLEFLYQYKS